MVDDALKHVPGPLLRQLVEGRWLPVGGQFEATFVLAEVVAALVLIGPACDKNQIGVVEQSYIGSRLWRRQTSSSWVQRGHSVA